MRIKNNSGKVLTYVGIILLIFAVIAAITMFTGNRGNSNTNTDFTKVQLRWDVGALDSGAFDTMEDTTMVSKYIQINKALKFDVAVNKSVTYFISVYDEDNNYLGDYNNGSPFNRTTTITLEDFRAQYPSADRIRLEITGMTEADNHIAFYEKLKYGNVISVYTSVSKEQSTTNSD